MSNKRKQKRLMGDDGFSLVELLVVLAIIGLIAALATPQVLRYLDGAKVSTTKTQIRNLQSALELYYLDNGDYPPSDVGLDALAKAPPAATSWNGPYIKGAHVDAWGNAFQYSLVDGAREPKIMSLGRDGKQGGDGLDADLGG